MKEKAQSKSDGKPKLGDIWKWLYKDFLLEMSDQMKFPVEVIGKYPRDNWKNGIGDEEFIGDRIESAIRHLEKLKTQFDNGTADVAFDDETKKHETACVSVNMMMVYYSLFGKED